MGFAILLTHDAARDLEETYKHIALHDSPQNADYALERIEKFCLSLVASFTGLWRIFFLRSYDC